MLLFCPQPRKLGFGTLRKKKQEDGEEYVCPMDVEMPKGRSFQKGYRGMELQIYEDDLDRLEQVMKSGRGLIIQNWCRVQKWVCSPK